jgi:hypothetical protein
MRPADAPDAASALAIEIRTDHQGRGLSARTLQAMAAICAEHGLHRLIAPVRPSWKERYPTVPIERYAAWRREDGLPFDPWLRVHACGWRRDPHARAAVDADHGDRGGVGGVDGLAYPESGEYVFPRGLAPLRVDRERDRGVYFEPTSGWRIGRLTRAPPRGLDARSAWAGPSADAPSRDRWPAPRASC